MATLAQLKDHYRKALNSGASKTSLDAIANAVHKFSNEAMYIHRTLQPEVVSKGDIGRFKPAPHPEEIEIPHLRLEDFPFDAKERWETKQAATEPGPGASGAGGHGSPGGRASGRIA